MEALSSLANTPLPTILVVAGVIFVFIALGGQFGAQVVTDRIKPANALIAGALFMAVGIALNTSGRPTPDGKVEPPVSGGSHAPAKEQPEDATSSIARPPRVIFTRSLGGNTGELPAEDIKEITLGTEKIFVYCTWFGVTAGKEYAYHSDIIDGNGTLVDSYDDKFVPDKTTWNTWTWYTIKNNVDRAGIWLFRLSLGEQKAEGRLIVTDK